MIFERFSLIEWYFFLKNTHTKDKLINLWSKFRTHFIRKYIHGWFFLYHRTVYRISSEFLCFIIKNINCFCYFHPFFHFPPDFGISGPVPKSWRKSWSISGSNCSSYSIRHRNISYDWRIGFEDWPGCRTLSDGKSSIKFAKKKHFFYFFQKFLIFSVIFFIQ